MDSTYLNASDGTGEAVRAVVAADRDIGNVEINVDSTDNWPAKWVATSGTVLASGVFDPDTICVFYGYTSGSFLYIDGFAPGYSDVGHTANQIIVIKPTTLWADTLVDSLGGGGDMTAAVYDPAGIGQQVIGTTATQTMSNKTLTSPVLNTSISGTAFLDEDDMVSNSATKVASQQSIKAYVDAAITSAKAALFPVGSYYINETNSTNPATLLGFGTWTAVTDKFIVGHGSTYTSTGGSATHNHDLSSNGYALIGLNSSSERFSQNVTVSSYSATYAFSGGTAITPSTRTNASALGGTTDTKNNVPPYQAAYIWRRTA